MIGSGAPFDRPRRVVTNPRERDYWVGFHRTRARRSLPYAVSLSPNGGIAHRVAEAWVYWRGGKAVGFGVVTDCRPPEVIPNMRLLAEPGHRVSCARCEMDLAVPANTHRLYVVRHRAWVKVGCTLHLADRVKALGGELVAAAVGDYAAERMMLAAITAPPLDGGREWFPPSAEAECVAALRLATGTLEAVAA